MRVKIYDYDNDTGVETLRAECQLRECFPDDENTLQQALYQLKTTGRYWVGGGAAPLVLLMNAER